jgi:threonine aldolase
MPKEIRDTKDNRTVDLRSDTVTQPTPAMRKAMAEAKVGDDVFGEDPTVNRLQEMAAKITGKEAALFVASGTMANLACQLVHCGRGDEMILGDQSHIFYYEQGGSAAVGGIHPRPIPNQPDGKLALEDIEAAIRPDNVHFPRSRLIVLENTHNRCYGMPLDAAYMAAIGELAHHYNLKLHVDGARIFNAATALEADVSELLKQADSVSFCLSKGLAAPIGSLVCGSTDFINRARRARKVLGGGMRQAGIVAAAGIVALNEMIPQLAEDHANAQKLARGLANIKGIKVESDRVKTNIVYLEIASDQSSENKSAIDFTDKLHDRGVKMLPTGPYQLRAVTHYGISNDDIEQTLNVMDQVLDKF